MDQLQFKDFDLYLHNQKGKIIHQIWFGIIPNKQDARKDFKELKRYRDSWILLNPNWGYICWDLEKCYQLVKNFYPQHLKMYNNYPYHIQRCDVVRYFILHRYGGLYADMDYYCNKSWDSVVEEYYNNLYLVETPNKFYSDVHISNSLMYSSRNHVFWSHLFIELERFQSAPLYYSRHMIIMFTTGPGLLNRLYNKYKIRYKLSYYPYKIFHPYGITSDILSLKKNSRIYAVHIGKGSWETGDSKLILFLYQDCKILLIILAVLIIPSYFYYIRSRRK